MLEKLRKIISTNILQKKPESANIKKSKREAKFEALMDELKFWGIKRDKTGVYRAIANELSWRMVMRIIHKLRRKRGVEQ